MPVFWAVVGAFGLSFLGCWMITRSSSLRKLGNVAPADDRWHQQATPGLGGIPLFVSFAAMVFASSALSNLPAAILLSTLPLVAVGVFDDLRPVRPGLKLLLQLFSAILFLMLVSRTGLVGFRVDFLLSLIWIVAVINAINLLDNMDGLAGGVSLIACITIALIAARYEQLAQISLLFVILAASLSGFLLLNTNPAKLFMGDAGALWVGLAVGTGSLIVAHANIATSPEYASLANPAAWLLPVVICAVPISDTLMVMVTRKHRGQAVSIGGRDHLSHRLVSIGCSERTSVAILWLVALLASLLALLIQASPPAVWAMPLSVFLLMLLTAVVWLVRVSSAELNLCREQSNSGST